MIYFKHYQGVIRSIAAGTGCSVLFGTETLTVQGASEEAVAECYGELVEALPSSGNLLRIDTCKIADMRVYLNSPSRLKRK